MQAALEAVALEGAGEAAAAEDVEVVAGKIDLGEVVGFEWMQAETGWRADADCYRPVIRHRVRRTSAMMPNAATTRPVVTKK